jgi:hypothetical protein
MCLYKKISAQNRGKPRGFPRGTRTRGKPRSFRAVSSLFPRMLIGWSSHILLSHHKDCFSGSNQPNFQAYFPGPYPKPNRYSANYIAECNVHLASLCPVKECPIS